MTSHCARSVTWRPTPGHDPLTLTVATARTTRYDYYDAAVDNDPNHVSPEDVAITVAANSFVNTAARLRQVHRGLAKALANRLVRS